MNIPNTLTCGQLVQPNRITASISEPRSPGEVSNAISEIHASLAALSDSLAELGQLIKPVMRAPAPETKGTDVVGDITRHSSVPVVSELIAIHRKIEDMNRLVRSASILIEL